MFKFLLIVQTLVAASLVSVILMQRSVANRVAPATAPAAQPQQQQPAAPAQNESAPAVPLAQ